MENAGASRLNYPTAVLMLDRYLHRPTGLFCALTPLVNRPGCSWLCPRIQRRSSFGLPSSRIKIACAVRSGPPLPELLAVHRGHVAFRTCFRWFLGKVHLRFTILHFHQDRIERLSILNRRICWQRKKTRQSHKGSASRLYRTAYRSGTTL